MAYCTAFATERLNGAGSGKGLMTSYRGHIEEKTAGEQRGRESWRLGSHGPLRDLLTGPAS